MSKLKNWIVHCVAIGLIGFVVLLAVSFFLLTDFAWICVAGFTYSTVKSAVFFCIFYELLFLPVEIFVGALKKALMNLLNLSEICGKIFMYGGYFCCTVLLVVFLDYMKDSVSAEIGAILLFSVLAAATHMLGEMK